MCLEVEMWERVRMWGVLYTGEKLQTHLRSLALLTHTLDRSREGAEKMFKFLSATSWRRKGCVLHDIDENFLFVFTEKR